MTHWSAPLVGIPYVELGRTTAGADCWGLVRLALALKGIELPSFQDVHPDDSHQIAALFEAGASSPDWIPVTSAAEFDLCLFRMGGFDRHVGVVVARGRMLHADRGTGRSVIDRYDGIRWAQRLVGIYRWGGLA